MWADKATRSHRTDGPANLDLTNPARRMISWALKGESDMFILYNASSFYYAKIKKGKAWDVKQNGVFGV